MATTADAKILTRAIARALSGKSEHSGPAQVFSGLDWKLAGKLPSGATHSVFQLLNHMVFWQDWVVSWLDGKKLSSTSNSWPGGEAPANEREWQRAVRRFRSGLGELAARSREADLLFKRGKTSRLEMLETVACHNSYHVGQVVILRQILGVWPPGGRRQRTF